MSDKTLLEYMREKEKDYKPWMYACYHIGHFISNDSRLCVCCLQEIPEEND